MASKVRTVLTCEIRELASSSRFEALKTNGSKRAAWLSTRFQAGISGQNFRSGDLTDSPLLKLAPVHFSSEPALIAKKIKATLNNAHFYHPPPPTTTWSTGSTTSATSP